MHIVSHPAPSFALGRLKSKREVKIKLTDFVDVPYVLKKVPARDFGHYGALPPSGWGMYSNDSLGDCVIAEAQHCHDLWERSNGLPGGLFNDATAIANYSAVTGYKPGDPSTDNGTDPEAMANYRKNTGIVDKLGKRHVIGAYCELKPGDFNEYLVASYYFGAVSVCMDFKSYMADEFNKGQPWNYARSGTDEGGHDTMGCGRHSGMGVVVTWGKLQSFTPSWYAHLSDQALAFVAPEWVNGTGKTPEGFDMAALNAALAAVTGTKALA